jgi:hypothetical protein
VKEVDEMEFDSAKLKYNLTLENIRKDFGQLPPHPQQLPIRKLEEPIAKFEPKLRWEGSSFPRPNTPAYRLREDRRNLRHRRR